MSGDRCRPGAAKKSRGRMLAHAAIGAAVALAACDRSPSGPGVEDCTTTTSTLRVGQVVSATTRGEERVLCLEKPAGGTYLVVPYLGAEPLAVTSFDLAVRTEGGRALDASGRAQVAPGGAPPLDSLSALARGTQAFEAELRARERAQLERFLPSPETRRRVPLALRAASAPGDLIELNVSANCDQIRRHTGVVVATSANAIILVDERNPANGYTRDDYELFARRYDELIQPVVANTFGTPSDRDGNGRVIVFFTRGVNEITPPGGVGNVAGFFWNGDLFPTSQCAGSNQGEVLYLAVPDPNGEAGTPIELATLRQVAVGTIGHELQHLINAALHLAAGATKFEETWLNEGLSVIAEELMFYRAAGMAARADLGPSQLLRTEPVHTYFNELAIGNVGRYNLFLQSPRTTSPMGADALGTRGATWAFLRYALDRRHGDDAATLRALAGSTSVGVANLAAAFGVDPISWMADWEVAVYLDGLEGGSDPTLKQPSWDFRPLIVELRSDRTFPLEVLALPASGYTLHLRPGNGAYLLVGGGESTLKVRVTPAGTLSSGNVRLTLARVQ